MQDIESLAQLAMDNVDARQWYADAQREIKVIREIEQWRVEHFTGILAVTSPRVAVRRNIRIALQYVGSGQFLSNVMRSIRKSVQVFEDSGEIHGPKTSAFYAALIGDVHAVVLDVHMANLLQVNQRTAFRRKGEIAEWTQAIRLAAHRAGMDARECQACLWFGHKRAIGEYPEAFPIVAEYRNWLASNRSFPRSGVIASDTFESSGERPIDDTF